MVFVKSSLWSIVKSTLWFVVIVKSSSGSESSSGCSEKQFMVYDFREKQ